MCDMAWSQLPIFFFLLFIFWLCWVFVAACGLSLVAASRGYLHCGARASHCSGFSCCRAQALGARASVLVERGLSSCGSWALERRLSSCGTWTWLFCGMWDPPGPGLEPVSPALAGGFSTTASPGKSQKGTTWPANNPKGKISKLFVETIWLNIYPLNIYYFTACRGEG